VLPGSKFYDAKLLWHRSVQDSTETLYTAPESGGRQVQQGYDGGTERDIRISEWNWNPTVAPKMEDVSRYRRKWGEGVPLSGVVKSAPVKPLVGQVSVHYCIIMVNCFFQSHNQGLCISLRNRLEVNLTASVVSLYCIQVVLDEG